MNLNEINTEIARLEEARTKLLNQKEFESEEVIKSLVWTKECHARLKINSLSTAGLPKYEIMVYGKIGSVPHVNRSITVMGDSPLYEYNMLFGKSFGEYPIFYTSSYEMIMRFIEEVEFAVLDFDEQTLQVLEAAKRKKGKKENAGRG